MRHNLKISVVIPCYNEEAGVRCVVPMLPDFIDEILIVDNNSTDQTGAVAVSLGARVVKECKQGYGAAYKCGLASATGDIIVTMDGDATYPAHAISYLIDTLHLESLDFVSAARMPIHFWHSINMIQRFFGNIVLTVSTWALFGVRLRDSQSGMWIFRKPILEKISVNSDGMPFSEEFKIKAFRHPDIRAREVPVQFKYIDRMGSSKLNLWGDGIRNLIYLFKLRFSKGKE